MLRVPILFSLVLLVRLQIEMEIRKCCLLLVHEPDLGCQAEIRRAESLYQQVIEQGTEMANLGPTIGLFKKINLAE